VREAVRRISARKGQVAAKDIAEHMGISMDSAYERLRKALKAGVITRSNAPEEGNRKFLTAAPRPRFIPRPQDLFDQINEGPERVRFVHPIRVSGLFIPGHARKSEFALAVLPVLPRGNKSLLEN
jgi:predicted ArsR family transcriptional regulator